MKILIVKDNFEGVTKNKTYNVTKVEYSDKYGNKTSKEQGILETVYYKNDNDKLWDDCKNIKEGKQGMACLSNEYVFI